MTRYVVDVCVAVKWFIPEDFSQEAILLLNADHNLLAPDYLLVEAANVLWKKVRRDEIGLEEGRQVLTALQNSPIQLTDTQALISLTFDLANQTGRSFYDCLYLHLAIQEDCQMVTADEKIIQCPKEYDMVKVPSMDRRRTRNFLIIPTLAHNISGMPLSSVRFVKRL